MRSVLTFIQRWLGLGQTSEKPFLGNFLTVAVSSEQPQRQQTEELPPANFTDGILNSDCLLPCLERTSNCLSEPTSHHMRATLQDMETACGSILRIVLWNRCPSSALSSSTHPSQPSLRLAPPSALRRRQHSGLFHFRQPQDHGASSVVFCRSPQERHVESGPLVTDLPCNVLSINNDNTSGQPPD